MSAPATARVDLCHLNAGAGDCYWPGWPTLPPMYFKCADRITEPVIEFPCTGSKHTGSALVVCSCECHTKPATAGAVGQYVPFTIAHRPITAGWRAVGVKP